MSSTWPVAGMIATMFMGSTLVTPLYVLFQDAFGFSTIALTIIYSMYVVGNVLALLFFGRISDQLGRRPVIFGAMIVAAASTVLFVFATSPFWLAWARMLSGFAIGLASGAGTAWLAELLRQSEKSHAALIATTANFIGLAIGSILAGAVGEYAPYPLKLPFVAYLAVLAITGVFIASTRETVEWRGESVAALLKPRIGIPRVILRAFVAPVITAFATFSLVGFYAALVPSVLKHQLQVENLALRGGIVGELFIVAAVAMIITRHLGSHYAMAVGLALLIPGFILLVVAQATGELSLLIADTALIGIAASLAYRGSLQVANEIAPTERRAEVLSSYFIACFIGNSVPVIGVGWLTTVWGPSIAISAFALVVGILVLGALAVTLIPGLGIRWHR